MMPKTAPSISEPVWNLTELLDRVDNDHELLRDLLNLFKEDFPRIMQFLKIAVTDGDLNKSATLSHTLKGMLANLGATRASRAASKLEKLASAGDSSSLRNAFESLERESESLLPELKAYMTGVRP